MALSLDAAMPFLEHYAAATIRESLVPMFFMSKKEQAAVRRLRRRLDEMSDHDVCAMQSSLSRGAP